MLGEGVDFESLNVETHKRLHKCSEIIRKRDLRVGDKKLNAISSTAGPEQVISMKMLQSKLKDNNKQGFEIKGIANPLGLFEFQSLAAPNVSVRRAAVDEVKRCYFSSPSPIPGHFRLLLSWDGKAKVCTRHNNDEVWIGFIEAFSEAVEAGEEKPWIEAFISVPVTVVVDMKEDEAAMFLSSLKMSESLVKAGQLSRKTPLIRIAEVARAAKMLPSPVTHQKIADWFAQVDYADPQEKVTLSTVTQCQQINSQLLADSSVLQILLDAEQLTVTGQPSAFDGFSKMAVIASKCAGNSDNRLYCCDALLSLQKAGLLPGAPSRDFLKGVKAKKTSYVEVLIARRRLRDYLLDLVPEGEQQTMRDLFLLVSKSLTAFPLEGVPLTAPSLVLAEMLRDLHNGSFDPTLRTFLSDYPGGTIHEMLALSAFSQRLEEHSKCVAAERGPDPCQDPEPIAATAGETAAETVMPSSTGSTAETPKPVETQIKDLCQEWQGTIRSLWSRQIQLFESPPGSWKMTYDLLKTSVAFKSARSTLTGDSRRAEEPKHMLAVMNINRAPVDFTAVELAKLLESLKDSEGSLLPGVILAIFEAQKDSVRQVLAKQTKGMAMRTLTIGYRQSDVERCAERIKSSSFLNIMENLVLITSTTLKLPTKRRMHFGDSNKGNLLTDVPLLGGGENGWQTPCPELAEELCSSLCITSIVDLYADVQFAKVAFRRGLSYVGFCVDESEKGQLMDDLDAAATESMCQVGSLSYRAQFAVALEKIRQQDSALAGDTLAANVVDNDQEVTRGDEGGHPGEEGGEESEQTEDDIVEPPKKKLKKLPEAKVKPKAKPKAKPEPKQPKAAADSKRKPRRKQ